MKIQVIPIIINHYDDVTVELIDVNFPEFNCVLLPEEHLKVGKPYKNKKILVASLVSENKAEAGFFVDTPPGCTEFSMITRWLLDGKRPVTHQINFKLDDQEYDFASQEAIFWSKSDDENNTVISRWPESVEVRACSLVTPKMKVVLNDNDDYVNDRPEVREKFSAGWLSQRVNDFILPSIPKSFLTNIDEDLVKLPSLEKAIVLKQ